MAESPSRPSLQVHPAAVCWLAVFGAALGEGVSAARAAFELGGSPGAGLAAGAAAVGLLLGALALPCAVLGELLGSQGCRGLGRALLGALGGGEQAPLAGLAVGLGSVLVGVPVLTAVLLGPKLIEAMTPAFASLALALACGAVCAAGALALVAAAGPLARAARRLGVARALRPALPALAVVGACGLALGTRMLPPAFLIAPGAAVVGALLGLWRTPRFLSRAAVRALLAAVSVAAGAVATLTLSVLPGEAQRSLGYRAAVTSTLLAAGAAEWDADVDGASPHFLGGDCDDTNPRVHPGARDVPGNGLDENCSGQDASRYKAPRRQAWSRPQGFPEQPNVVIVLLDALRPDRLGLAGYERPTSPAIDALSKRGVWFKNAYTTAPSTRYALASMFTGRDVRKLPHRVTPGNGFILNPSAHTVAERLDRAGYDAMGYTISYVIQHNLGLGQGFRVWDTPWPVKQWERTYRTAATETTDKALAYLADRSTEPGSPFLLFLHYRCTHDPYLKYPQWDFGDSDSDRYDSALRYCDSQLARLFKTLDARADADRTALFLVSDHGELFGEHGVTNHGNSLYEPDVRIAMLAKVPGATPRTIDTPVQLSDLAPTLLELASIRVPSDTEAHSLLPLMFGGRVDAPRPLFMFTELWRGNVHHEADAILEYPYKYVADRRTRGASLFDVARDPAEQQNLVASDPKRAARLAELLEAYLAR